MRGWIGLGLTCLPRSSDRVPRQSLGRTVLILEQSFEGVGFDAGSHGVATRREYVQHEAPARFVEGVLVPYAAR